MSRHRRISGAVLVLLFALLVLWPALYNGQPFYFPDTTAYVRGADAGIQRLSGISSAWSTTSRNSRTDNSAPSRVRPADQYESLSSIEDRAVLSGRSVYYGALLYFGYIGGEFWLAVLIQGIVLVSALVLTLRACQLNGWAYASMLVVMACVTPAALFSSFAMPDIFAALAILACAVLIGAGSNVSGWDRVFWFALLTFSLLAHTANSLVIAGMLTVAVSAKLALKFRANTLGVALVAVSLLLAFLGEAAFSYGVARALGSPPLRPPFLMARAIADGPGYAYLLQTCPENGFSVCRYMQRLPLSADEFLWTRDPKQGVFAVVDAEARRDLSDEQVRFFLSVLRYDLRGQLGASAKNATKQATLLGLPEFAYPEKRRKEFAAKMPAANYERMLGTAAYNETMPLRGLAFVSYVTAAMALGYLGYVSSRSRIRPKTQRLNSIRVAWLLLAGVALNAAVLGALSTPHHRYQARVIWLLPVIALVVDFERRRGWWEGLLVRMRIFLKERTGVPAE